MVDLFDPVEQAILCDYFGVPRPEALRHVDVLAERRSRRGVAAPVRVEPDTFGRLTGNSLGNAVARMLLAGTDPRLPPWGRGNFGYSMAILRRGARYNEVNCKWLAFLFEINWAENGPYFSWPERYYAVRVPDHERVVIVIAGIQPDIHGYEFLSIGYFGSEVSLKVGARQVIIEWWSDYRYRGREESWEFAHRGAIFSIDEVMALRAAVWKTEPQTVRNVVRIEELFGEDGVKWKGTLQ